MRRLVVFSGEGTLSRSQLSAEVQRGDPFEGALVSLREARMEFEREHIARALAQHRGHRSRTAGALGLTRQGLLAKIQQHGLG
jgi:DNA-binding NtrC family response regulator